LRAADLFCGAGGLSLGLKRAGIEVVQAIDEWEEAIEVYRCNVGNHAKAEDILYDFFWEIITLKDLKLDLIAGGPPCQDYSSAGMKIEGDRAMLMVAFAMIVAIVRPEWVLIENVQRANRSATWWEAQEVLKSAGYGLTQTVVDASFYGVGQARKRFIAVGRLGEADGFLLQAIEDAKSETPTTIRDILGDLDGDHVFVRPFTNGRGVRSIDEPSPTIIRTSRGGASVRYLAKPSTKDPVPASMVPSFTQAQVSRIQGFPEDWDWSPAARVRDRDQMIANAMPPPLAEALGRIILARHHCTSLPRAEDGFSEWLKRRGYKGAVLRNKRYILGRARRLLGGRMLGDIDHELRALEALDEFAGLSASARSDIRSTLRLHAEWREIEADGNKSGKKRSKAAKS